MDLLQRLQTDLTSRGKQGYQLLGGDGSFASPKLAMLWRRTSRPLIFLVVTAIVVSMMAWPPVSASVTNYHRVLTTVSGACELTCS